MDSNLEEMDTISALRERIKQLDNELSNAYKIIENYQKNLIASNEHIGALQGQLLLLNNKIKDNKGQFIDELVKKSGEKGNDSTDKIEGSRPTV